MEKNRYKIYRPEGEVKACIQLLHGMAEYRERYEYFINSLTDEGYACIMHDHLGHGLTCPEDDLGFFASKKGWQKVIDEVGEVMDIMKAEYPEKPYILFAHSMGTIVARDYIQRNDDKIDALILSGAPNYVPTAKMGKNLAGIIAGIKGERSHSKLLDNLFVGGFNKGFDSPNQWLSVNQDNVDKYNAHNRCGYPFTSRAYADMAEGLVQTADVKAYKVNNSELPVLFFAGEFDPCIGGDEGFTSSIKVLVDAGYNRVDQKIFDGLRHETLNEKNRDEVIQYVKSWLNELKF